MRRSGATNRVSVAGAAVGIVLWFCVTAFATLLGAELNARLEMRVVNKPAA
jgi:uncharacterized BrkB/YihY/UPF0761 family membrane protein